MRKLLILSSAIVVAIGILNIVMFAIWWHTVDATASMPDTSEYTVEALALNVTFLEITLGVTGAILALMGIFGYTEIKNAAVRRAVEAAEAEARETVSEQFKIFERNWNSRSSPPSPEHPGTYGLGDQPVTEATPAKDE